MRLAPPPSVTLHLGLEEPPDLLVEAAQDADLERLRLYLVGRPDVLRLLVLLGDWLCPCEEDE